MDRTLARLRYLDQAHAHRVSDEFHSVVDTELRSNVGSVAHDRPLADVEKIADFLARLAFDYQLEHFLLAFSEEPRVGFRKRTRHVPAILEDCFSHAGRQVRLT